MSFLVLSPALAPNAQRGRLAARSLHAFDHLLAGGERRMRDGHCAVYRLPTCSAAQKTQLQSNVDAKAQAEGVDRAWLARPYRWKDFSVLAMDMDSTVITIECIDEIADHAGKKEQVAAITEAAMRGEITDYAESLRRRVALLKGLPASVIQEVIRYRLKFTPGVKALVDTANRHGLHTLLVSGGFVPFTDFVANKIGFAQTRSNTLEIIDGKLTGRLIGTIVDARVKHDTLRDVCRKLKVPMKRSIAIGDGANDLLMMAASGLSIAHRAKPAVATQAMQAIRHGGLDNVLDWFE
jgi:phosphoserine phosphatase